MKKNELKKAENVDDRLITIQELCTRWNMKRGSIYNRVCKKTLPVVHIGRSIRFRLSDIQRLEKYDKAI